jgi:hypothetical protein
MSNTEKVGSTAPGESGVFVALVGLAVVLCVICCALILLIPTQSISVDTVYRGF